jgi:hypothetical protein
LIRNLEARALEEDALLGIEHVLLIEEVEIGGAYWYAGGLSSGVRRGVSGAAPLPQFTFIGHRHKHLHIGDRVENLVCWKTL